LFAYVLAPGAVGQAGYVVLRVWLAAFPLLWLRLVERGAVSSSPLPRERRAEALAVAFGLSALVVAAVLGVYTLVGGEWIDVEHFRDVVARAGLGTRTRFAFFGVYIALVNSLVEEYVWRWFVYRRCEELVGSVRAVPLAAACFTAHHVVAFSVQFGASVGLLASLGVFVAGCIWSACYLRYRSIWPGWIVHVVADVVGLALGWRLMFG